MSHLSLVVAALVIFGAAWGVGHSALSYPFRKILFGDGKNLLRVYAVKGLECVGCFSFWLGVVTAAFTRVLGDVFQPAPLGCVCCGLFFAATSLLLGKHVGLLDEHDPQP